MKEVIKAFEKFDKAMIDAGESFGPLIQILKPLVAYRWYHKIPFYGSHKYVKDIQQFYAENPEYGFIDFDIAKGDRE